MLVLEISKVSETTWRTSVKETLQEGDSLPFLSEPGSWALSSSLFPHYPMPSTMWTRPSCLLPGYTQALPTPSSGPGPFPGLLWVLQWLWEGTRKYLCLLCSCPPRASSWSGDRSLSHQQWLSQQIQQPEQDPALLLLGYHAFLQVDPSDWSGHAAWCPLCSSEDLSPSVQGASVASNADTNLGCTHGGFIWSECPHHTLTTPSTGH